MVEKEKLSFFKSKADEFDPGKTLTDTFLFQGGAYNQKAGSTICVQFLQ